MEADTQFDVSTEHGVSVVQIIGDLDYSNIATFRSTISELTEKGEKQVVLDMAAVGFMDSSGMAGIVFAIRRLSAVAGRLALANCSAQITRKLDISGLTKMPDAPSLFASLEEALQSFQ